MQLSADAQEQKKCTMDALLLNYYYEPVARISWQRAITQWVKGKLEIIESHDETIKSPSVTMNVPSVVRELTRYKRKNAIKFSRDNVYARDRHKCQYCGDYVTKNTATYDHVIPRDLGGQTKWDNIVIACFGCNQKKRNRTPEQAGMRLLSLPMKAKSLPNMPHITFRWSDDMPESWKNYMYSMISSKDMSD